MKEKLFKIFTSGVLMSARREKRKGWFWTVNQLLFFGLIGALLVRWLRLREEGSRLNGDYDLQEEGLQLERYEPGPAGIEVDLSGAMETTGVDNTLLQTAPEAAGQEIPNPELRAEAAQVVEEAPEEPPAAPFTGSTLLEEGAEAAEALGGGIGAPETRAGAPETRAGAPETRAGAPETGTPAAQEPGAAAPSERDDLIVLEGIGPKISEILQNAGIHTYRQLADTDVARLSQILQENNLRMADPTTWPEQAKLLADGDMQGFNSLKDKLKAGRRV